MSQRPISDSNVKDKTCARKTLVRNCRTAPAAPKSCVSPSRETQKNSAVESTARSSSRAAAGQEFAKKINLSEPQLHSSLKLQENIDKMKTATKSVRFETKASPEPPSQPSKKLNIRFDQKIYKDLIDLRVSEEDLGLRSISVVGKQKGSTKLRDPVPVLSDYYRPCFNKEYVVKPYPPSFAPTLIPPRKLSSSTVLQAYKRWNVDDPQLNIRLYK